MQHHVFVHKHVCVCCVCIHVYRVCASSYRVSIALYMVLIGVHLRVIRHNLHMHGCRTCGRIARVARARGTGRFQERCSRSAALTVGMLQLLGRVRTCVHTQGCRLQVRMPCYYSVIWLNRCAYKRAWIRRNLSAIVTIL